MATIFTCGNGKKVKSPADITDLSTACRHWHKMDETGNTGDNVSLADSAVMSGTGRSLTSGTTTRISYADTNHFGGINSISLASGGGGARSALGSLEGSGVGDFSICQLLRQEGQSSNTGGYVVEYGIAYSACLLLFDSAWTGAVTPVLYFNNGGEYYFPTADAVVLRDTDLFLVMTHKGSDGEVKCYVDGVEKAMASYTARTGAFRSGEYASAFGGAQESWAAIGNRAHGSFWEKVLVPADFVEATGGEGRRHAIANGIGRGIGRGMR
jgi:hypothetical protein